MMNYAAKDNTTLRTDPITNPGKAAPDSYLPACVPTPQNSRHHSVPQTLIGAKEWLLLSDL